MTDRDKIFAESVARHFVNSRYTVSELIEKFRTFGMSDEQINHSISLITEWRKIDIEILESLL